MAISAQTERQKFEDGAFDILRKSEILDKLGLDYEMSGCVIDHGTPDSPIRTIKQEIHSDLFNKSIGITVKEKSV